MATAQATLEILNKNKDKYFNNLKYRSEQICAYIIDEAKRQGVELTVQGHFSSPSFHMINEKLTDYDQWTADLMNRDGVLRCVYRRMVFLQRAYPG